MASEYVPSAREKAFLDTVESPKYDRQMINGLRPFFTERAPEDMKGFYSKDEIAASALIDVRGVVCG